MARQAVRVQCVRGWGGGLSLDVEGTQFSSSLSKGQRNDLQDPHVEVEDSHFVVGVDVTYWRAFRGSADTLLQGGVGRGGERRRRAVGGKGEVYTYVINLGGYVHVCLEVH